MSFCGIVKCKNGIVLFGDSKSTERGKYIESPHRKNVQKTFFNENLAVFHTGSNEFKEHKIEDIINYCMNKSITIVNFIECIKKYFHDNNIKFSNETNFMLGFYEFTSNTFAVYNFKETVIPKEIKNFYLLVGISFYIDFIEQFLYKYPKGDNQTLDIDVYEMSKLLECEVDRLIKIYNTTGYYNPVGLPLKFTQIEYKRTNENNDIVIERRIL